MVEKFEITEGFSETELISLIKKRLKLNNSENIRLTKRSIDARQSTIYVVVSFDIGADSEEEASKYQDVSNEQPVIIIGAGPAGLFAALRCIELGLKPIVIERGKNVRERRKDIASINRNVHINENSNYCFGEGGAGTYSDGKLYTRSNKRGNIRRILNKFVENGATREILFDAHPHIGTNKLPKVVSSITETILRFGGLVHFNTQFKSFLLTNNKIEGILTEGGHSIKSSCVILATGHSAHDVFKYLYQDNIAIEQKAFAIGVRVEHPQSFINANQYKRLELEYLPAASYSLSTQVDMGHGWTKGVFSFCMCPGGFIVPASTHLGELVVNGMSPSKRDSRFANSGLVVTVDERDFGSKHPLAGLDYQSKIEATAYEAGGADVQIAPSQLISDFVNNKRSTQQLETSYQPGLKPTSLFEYLPRDIAGPLQLALPVFNKQLRGYATNIGQLIGLESRTSSPVRIPRDSETLMHPTVQGLFPCGEGAGYAGGILSAAMDGERCAEGVKKYLLSA